MPQFGRVTQKEECIMARKENSKKKSPGKGKRFIQIIIFIAIAIFAIIRFTNYPIKVGDPDASVPPSPSVNISNYSEIELLNLEGHPTIYSDFQGAVDFYAHIGDDRVKVITGREYSILQRSFETFSDEDTLIYFIQSTGSEESIGEVHINLFGEDLYQEMTIDKAVTLLMEYFPSDFSTYYKTDSSYQYSGNNTTAYVYSCRLNEKGVEYHNGGHFEYSYYYYFKIFHRRDEKMWTIETGPDAYGGKSVDWIENYADPWDIDLIIGAAP